MTKQQIVTKIIEKSEKMAEEIKRGKDVEIKTSNSGLKIQSVDKKVIQ